MSAVRSVSCALKHPPHASRSPGEAFSAIASPSRTGYATEPRSGWSSFLSRRWPNTCNCAASSGS